MATPLPKANHFAKELNLTDFTGTSGWLERFKNRHGIHFRTICGESKSVDDNSTALTNWHLKLENILQRYSPSDVYNADETGLFFRMLPNKTYEFKGVDCSGGKKSKDRLTVLVCSNMDGSDKLPLLVIGKSEKPRCFKNIKTLPTHYTHQKRAWMDGRIFSDWLRKLDNRMRRLGRKIAMVIDNCQAHPHVKNLNNIELIFLPPNTTSKTQPMDQGVIYALKNQYRKRIVLRQIRAIDCKETLQITILDALRQLQQSWSSIKPSTIQNCFRKANFTTDTNSVPTDEDDDDEDDDDDLDNIPLSRLVELSSENLLDFIHFDDHSITTSSTDDDSAIIQDIIASRVPTINDDSDDGDNTDQSTDTTPPSINDAQQALDIVRTFFECTENAQPELQMLCALSKRLTGRQFREMGKLKQMTMLDFTSKHSD